MAVQGAFAVFLRYGFAKTTMADLAVAAKLSRPSLYELFPGKNEIFAAVVHQLSDQSLQQYRDLLPRLRSLRSKLQRLCCDWGTHGLRLIERHPDAKDLFDLDVPAVREMYEDFAKLLFEVIATEGYTSAIPPEKLVRNLVFSLKGLKDAARDVDDMEQLIVLQVDVFLANLRAPS